MSSRRGNNQYRQRRQSKPAVDLLTQTATAIPDERSKRCKPWNAK